MEWKLAITHVMGFQSRIFVDPKSLVNGLEVGQYVCSELPKLCVYRLKESGHWIVEGYSRQTHLSFSIRRTSPDKY